MEKRELSSTFGGNANWCSHYGKWYRYSSKKLKIEQPYDLAISLLVVYLMKTKISIRKSLCMLMFIAALFAVVTIWKQPKCPLIDEWIKTNGLLLSHKKERNLAIWGSMAVPRRCYAK